MASTSKVRMWRWHTSPLRRRSDVVEAWVLLLGAVAMAVGGVVIGVITFFAVQDTATHQQSDRHRVTAVLTEDAQKQAPDALYIAASDEVTSATVQWTAPDGSEHQGKAQVPTDGKAGGDVPVWVDNHGSQVSPPPGPVMAGFQAVLCASLATGTLVALLLGVQQGVRARLDHRRADQWERDWAEVEPRWRPRTP